jgi:phosphatidate cytidylyltransferase
VPALADPASAANRWGDLRLRAASAAVLVPLALLCLWLGGLAWLLLVLAAGIGMGWEWWSLWRRRHGASRMPTPGLLAGAVYLLPAMLALPWLRAAPEVGMINVLFVLLVVWTSDIGAYVAGRALGGPKLAPRISPGKTWSGAAGGTLAAVALGVVLQLGWPHGSMAQAIGVTAALSIVSQLGDLFESGVKRYYGAKDSSRLIPGHGGLLDRLDGVLAAAPAAALLAMWLGPGLTLW